MYCTNTLPLNLCPYFWKLVLAIVTLPITVFSFFPFVKNKYFEERFAPLFIIAFCELFTAAIGLLVSTMFGWVDPNGPVNLKDLGIANAVGLSVFAIVAVVCYIEQSISSKKKDSKSIVKEKKPSIIIEYIKAKKNKHCPMIEWED
jgi:hypothetical protein